jgi:hypothetical protein
MYITQLGNNQPTNAVQHLELDTYLNLPFLNPIWSPDGQYLALINQKVLSVYSTSSGEQVSLNGNGYPPANGIVAFSWSTDSQSLLVADDQNNIWQWTIDNY